MIPRTAIPIGNEELFSILFPVMRNGNEEIADFEMDLASYLGALKVFAVNSGRTALFSALQALGLKKGENVIVPAYTCAIVFEVILRLGLKPNFVDVDPETYNFDPELIPKAITSGTRAIIPVHLFGAPCEMDQIMEIASKYGLFVVEDVAQALGAEYKGRKLGTFGDLAMFSFGPGKSVMSGEGGGFWCVFG
jgi:perosamine synthetase